MPTCCVSLEESIEKDSDVKDPLMRQRIAKKFVSGDPKGQLSHKIVVFTESNLPSDLETLNKGRKVSYPIDSGKLHPTLSASHLLARRLGEI